MMTRLFTVAATASMSLISVPPAAAQEVLTREISIDSSALDLRRQLRRAVERTRDLELQSVVAVQGASLDSLKEAQPLFRAHRDAMASLESLLDTVVFHTIWGPAELEHLRFAYPGSRMLDRFAGELAMRQGRSSEAVRIYERLVQRHSADVEAQRGYAAALVADGRNDDARAALVRSFEMAPEDTAIFRQLLRLNRSDSSVTALLEQVRRLQIRRSSSRALIEWEVELLQRLGRRADAMVAAKRLEEPKP